VNVSDVAAAMVLGFAGGLTGGLVGIGGAVLFVPALVVFLDLSQVEAQATSLLAVVVVGLVGAFRQHGYGNVRVRDGLLVGALSPLGVAAGAVLANAISERTLELAFASVQLYFAWRLARRALRPQRNDFPPAA
jgi:uncharacterized membrane protein YfcA